MSRVAARSRRLPHWAAQWLADWQALPASWLFGSLMIVIVCGAAAGAFLARQEPHIPVLSRPQAALQPGTRLYPELLNRLNDVTRLVLRDGVSTVTIARQVDTWTISGYDGIPVDTALLREQLFNLARLEVVENKTRTPQLYPQLDVAPLGTAGSNGRELALYSDAEKTMATLIIGKPEPVKGNRLSRQFYVRRADDPQALLVRGTLQLPRSAIAWLDRDLLHVDARRWQEIVRAGAAPLRRVSPDAPVLNPLLLAFEAVQWQGLRRRSELSNAPVAAKISGVTFDGMQLTAVFYRHGGAVFATFDASRRSAPDTGSSEGLLNPEAVRRDIAALQQMTAQWAFQVPQTMVDAVIPATTAP